jgi:hypothetical protein
MTSVDLRSVSSYVAVRVGRDEGSLAGRQVPGPGRPPVGVGYSRPTGETSHTDARIGELPLTGSLGV